ncbi:hypothetical protein L596_027353 [Steinernema carpocapsae]|uniref:Uncharacterized protein n=1 Tax=Steinernema carpocapsae TaxID=34508 RepID=A0A4U5M424_STECR|nr:hypothetical protein L596_027353 [Steinernema carpocapsae]
MNSNGDLEALTPSLSLNLPSCHCRSRDLSISSISPYSSRWNMVSASGTESSGDDNTLNSEYENDTSGFQTADSSFVFPDNNSDSLEEGTKEITCCEVIDYLRSRLERANEEELNCEIESVVSECRKLERQANNGTTFTFNAFCASHLDEKLPDYDDSELTTCNDIIRCLKKDLKKRGKDKTLRKLKIELAMCTHYREYLKAQIVQNSSPVTSEDGPTNAVDSAIEDANHEEEPQLRNQVEDVDLNNNSQIALKPLISGIKRLFCRSILTTTSNPRTWIAPLFKT